MSLLALLAQDKNIIIYRKELNVITGSVTATILLQQLIYWDNKNNHKPFYKFIEPCENEKYNNGDSWTEELGFSKYEFATAYKKLEKLGIVSKKKNMMHVTFYTLNSNILAKLIKPIYGSEENQSTEVKKTDLDYSKSFDTETTTETTTEIKKEKKKKKPLTLQTKIENKLSEYPNINIQAFNEWIERKKYKDIAPITKLLNMLSKYDHTTQQKIVDSSIMNNYKGLFEPKTQKQPYNTPKMQTLNTDVNVWDMVQQQNDIGKQQEQQEQQGVING